MTAPATSMQTTSRLSPLDDFRPRHIGPNEADVQAMLERLGCADLDQLMAEAIPDSIRLTTELDLPQPRGEREMLHTIRDIASRNELKRSFIGTGYFGTVTPPVILRNVLENPGWYTQYTPYQSEISQGRLTALLNFQTMVTDLTGLPLSNASMLDEATAAAEAMNMAWNLDRQKRSRFFVGDHCHPQTIAVVKARAVPLGIEVVEGAEGDFEPTSGEFFGALVQSPDTFGTVHDFSDLCQRAHEHGTQVVVACDPLALTLCKSPGEMDADLAVGTTQRFGVPVGYGGPHAAFLAARDDYKRLIPGRVVGVSKDVDGQPAVRLALQTREQHIRRDRATSNICTAQVLLAVMASMYAVYHGPEGLRAIAHRVHRLTSTLATGLARLGTEVSKRPWFDTLLIRGDVTFVRQVRERSEAAGLNLRILPDGIGISLDEPTTREDLAAIAAAITDQPVTVDDVEAWSEQIDETVLQPMARRTDFLTHEVFHRHRSEHEMLRYLHHLQGKDLSLTTSMIPLGSCTMKLNGTAEMMPVTWPEFAFLHPFAPLEQALGYRQMIEELSDWLANITGFAAVSLQPNAGAQGEYAGLLAIRQYLLAQGEAERDVCLIPVSAHGTNPASAVMAGMRVVAVACDDQGNIDVEDLQAKATEHADTLAALMVTYPSTHGVFEATIRDVCDIVHRHGGQVYMDGANMNAQVGLCAPGAIGADVCHLNLHKTFCIPHGGGGPGVGPIGVASHLAPFLPGHPFLEPGSVDGVGQGDPVSAAPFGSAGILAISWMYIALMGGDGLKRASEVAILNANYMLDRLSEHYDILYTGERGRVAHEFVVDCRPFKTSANITVDDIAKRLMDYGFHAPTMSWPVPGTLMVEPTESESKAELDRFCDTMIAIRAEIAAIEDGSADPEDNVLKGAPHTAATVCADRWERPYSRQTAAYPLPWVKEHKFWPSVGRVDNSWGDRNLVCTCPPVEAWS